MVQPVIEVAASRVCHTHWNVACGLEDITPKMCLPPAQVDKLGCSYRAAACLALSSRSCKAKASRTASSSRKGQRHCQQLVLQ